jgi:hypothetical protein
MACGDKGTHRMLRGAAGRQETGGGDGVEGVCAEGACRERGEREMVVGQRSQD